MAASSRCSARSTGFWLLHRRAFSIRPTWVRLYRTPNSRSMMLATRRRDQHLPPKTEVLRPLLQQARQAFQLLIRQPTRRTTLRLGPQRLWPTFPPATHPRAHRCLADAQGFGYRLLAPTLFLQLPGAQAARFPPILWFLCSFLVHAASLPSLATFVHLFMFCSVVAGHDQPVRRRPGLPQRRAVRHPTQRQTPRAGQLEALPEAAAARSRHPPLAAGGPAAQRRHRVRRGVGQPRRARLRWPGAYAAFAALFPPLAQSLHRRHRQREGQARLLICRQPAADHPRARHAHRQRRAARGGHLRRRPAQRAPGNRTAATQSRSPLPSCACRT